MDAGSSPIGSKLDPLLSPLLPNFGEFFKKGGSFSTYFDPLSLIPDSVELDNIPLAMDLEILLKLTLFG